MATIRVLTGRQGTTIRSSLTAATRSSIRQMTWLEPTDDAAVALAVRYAETLDRAAAGARAAEIPADADADAAARIRELEAQVEAVKVLGWLGPHVTNILRDLGGTPASRAKLSTGSKVGGKLAELRGRRQA